MSVSPSASLTVRHTPFTQTESPRRVSSVSLPTSITSRAMPPSPTEITRPVPSTSPVNKLLLRLERVQRHRDVFPHLLDGVDTELRRSCHAGDVQGAHERHPFGPEQFRGVEQGQLVGEPPSHEPSGRLSASLHQNAPDAPPAQLLEHEDEVQLPVHERRRHNLDARSA